MEQARLMPDAWWRGPRCWLVDQCRHPVPQRFHDVAADEIAAYERRAGAGCGTHLEGVAGAPTM